MIYKIQMNRQKNYDRYNWRSQMVVNLLTDHCAYCDVLMHLEHLLICQLFFVSTITYIKFKSALSIDECDHCHHGVYDLVKICIHNYELYGVRCYILPNIINTMSLF